MKKQTMADKMAQKAFFNPQFQKSWAVHQKAFGPILTPAFREDYQAKVHLAAALGHISSKNLPQALLKLNALEKHLQTDADRAAWLFFMGLFCEYAGRFDQMAQLYDQANAYGHRFYLPYLKSGRYHLDSRDYALAAQCYQSAIGCFHADALSQPDRQLLASAYTNLASCLLMMHRREEAAAALDSSRALASQVPGRAAPEAILHALQGDAPQAQACLYTLKTQAPAAYEAMKKSVEAIFAGTEPQFFQIPADPEGIQRFWVWFEENASQLKNQLDAQEYDAVIDAFGGQLLEALPFLDAQPPVALGKNDTGYVFQLKDCHSVSLTAAYAALLSACPDAVKTGWLFDVVH